MFLLQTVTVISLTVILLGSVEGKGVQMQRDVQCCMQYSQGKVRTKDVLRFEVQTEGPDCSIKAIILYTKKVVKCADPRDRKVKRLLRKLLQRQRTKAHRIMWLHPHGNLPVMSEVGNMHRVYTQGSIQSNPHCSYTTLRYYINIPMVGVIESRLYIQKALLERVEILALLKSVP
ncbi:C-C motif chemokine 21 isoform X1 [Coregonus clupeaformis]|uniref:C-C motif chemokine 21 isoform X1 n=1 Tax=Coregonus clupeaformis TaxID=59861 RepID=UPI001BE01262|nr:C-C motif chemokine 21 isoform X1 [Coregonus clupeaformis]